MSDFSKFEKKIEIGHLLTKASAKQSQTSSASLSAATRRYPQDWTLSSVQARLRMTRTIKILRNN